MEKYGFIYVWYDVWRKMYYIGCHWGHEDDGYICSSNRMRDAYRRRPQDFKRKIIQKGISRERLLDEEYKWISMIPDDQLGKKYYNLSKRHFGHWSTDDNISKPIRQKISETVKLLHQDPEYKKKFLEGRKKLPPVTEETIKKRVDKIRGVARTEETKQKISKSLTGRVYGPLKEETKKKLSNALSGEKNPFYGKKHDPETVKEFSKKISATMKGRHPKNATEAVRGSFWWTNGTTNKRSKVSPGSEWIRGKCTK